LSRTRRLIGVDARFVATLTLFALSQRECTVGMSSALAFSVTTLVHSALLLAPEIVDYFPRGGRSRGWSRQHRDLRFSNHQHVDRIGDLDDTGRKGAVMDGLAAPGRNWFRTWR
jgi:hypothetical protein